MILFKQLCTGIALIFILAKCSNQSIPAGSSKLKARFEISALCSNHTFSIIEGSVDTSLVEASWTNPQTDSTYKNAFGIGNPCDLPKNLKAGDEFYFKIDTTSKGGDCAVCMAYYPTPKKKLNIKVLEVLKK